MEIWFYIRRGVLEVCPSNGLAYEISATSGRGGCRNNPSMNCQKAPFEGPLPVGIYYINPNDLDDPNLIWDILRRTRGDWGDWRVRLIPGSTTNTYGRSNFFLHGGDMPGSAGCIDFGGGVFGNKDTSKLRKDIKEANGKIRVQVVP